MTQILQNRPFATYILHLVFGYRQILTANTNNVQHVLKTHFNNYPKGYFFINVFFDFLSNKIFNVDGEFDSNALQRKRGEGREEKVKEEEERNDVASMGGLIADWNRKRVVALTDLICFGIGEFMLSAAHSQCLVELFITQLPFTFFSANQFAVAFEDVNHLSSQRLLIFLHAADFTPVCTTELGKMAAYLPEFEKRGPGCKVTYPIVADASREIIKQLNMVDPNEKDSSENQLPSRAMDIMGSDNKIKLSFLYPARTGRNMDEVLRAVDSLLIKASKYKVATPANWKQGDLVVISPDVSNEEAKLMFPNGFEHGFQNRWFSEPDRLTNRSCYRFTGSTG
ncbi:1-Cys peroxiredoxin PER1 [Hibiscus syriacus]|uniref:thioredoxin-dependent peroxiredoxin n=1 Tax=Hibiscus syriacus TaxID=106335 RepID=A0A6A3D097_HIBSY|nr:1-Cys peroxiredoxin PER1 [Hibiscus syriacus]